MVTANRAARVGAVLQRRAFRELAERLDAETYGGAALLGLGGTVVIAHGATTARGVRSACVLARDLARGQIVDKIRERLGPGRPGHFRRRRDPPPGPSDRLSRTAHQGKLPSFPGCSQEAPTRVPA